MLRNFPKTPAALELRRLRTSAKKVYKQIEQLENATRGKSKKGHLKKSQAVMEAITDLHDGVRRIQKKIEDQCIWTGPLPEAKKRKKAAKRK